MSEYPTTADRIAELERELRTTIAEGGDVTDISNELERLRNPTDEEIERDIIRARRAEMPTGTLVTFNFGGHGSGVVVERLPLTPAGTISVRIGNGSIVQPHILRDDVRPVPPRCPSKNGGSCWTHRNCEAREALAKLRATLQANHADDIGVWGPLVDAIAEAIPEPLG